MDENETSYSEYAKHICLDSEQVIKAEVRTEGLTEAKDEKVRHAFKEFCDKLKEM